MSANVRFVGRGGEKLQFALEQSGLDPSGKTAADLGCNVGGFCDCLLQAGAVRVYAVDTGYGVLDWKLRTDPRVVVMERTNALHVALPEPVDVSASDVAWTKQRLIVPAGLGLLKPGGRLLSLFKPQYEAERRQVRGGRVADEDFEDVLDRVLTELRAMNLPEPAVFRLPPSPGGRNLEAFLVFRAPA